MSARLKPNTVTLDRLPNTVGRRSFILPKGGQIPWKNRAGNREKTVQGQAKSSEMGGMTLG